MTERRSPTTATATASRAVAPNAIAVASGKGGVGKTWLSVTLAHAMAKNGRRVLLFDGDLGLANVDIQLGLTPAVDLGAVLEQNLSIEKAVTRHEGGFDVIAGRSGSASLATLTGTRLRTLADDLFGLAAHYDHLILDLGAGIERTVRHLASRCGLCLVVTTDEPTALTDAYAFIKLSTSQDGPANIRVVVNLVNSASEGERTYGTLLKACQSFLKIAPPLAGIVRRDSRVKDSIRAQTPILTRYPSAPAGGDVAAIAQHLIEAP